MAAAFASLIAKINDSVIGHLSNKVLIVNGQEVEGIYTNGYDEVGFTESSNPAFVAKSEHVLGIEHGMEAYAEGGEKFRVVGVKPDGFGMSVIEPAVEWHT